MSQRFDTANQLESDKLLPPAGSDGQVLMSDDGQVGWADLTAGDSLPTGGTTGQALVKASNNDGDVEWASIAQPNAVTTNTVQTITANKTFSGQLFATGATDVTVQQVRNIYAGTGAMAVNASLPAGTIYIQYQP